MAGLHFMKEMTAHLLIGKSNIMFFLYTPSIYGFASAFIFLILEISSINEDSFLEATGWMILTMSYIIKHLPKFFVLRFVNLFALVLLIIGFTIVFYAYSDEISFLRDLIN